LLLHRCTSFTKIMNETSDEIKSIQRWQQASPPMDVSLWIFFYKPSRYSAHSSLFVATKRTPWGVVLHVGSPPPGAVGGGLGAMRHRLPNPSSWFFFHETVGKPLLLVSTICHLMASHMLQVVLQTWGKLQKEISHVGLL
jgi:hypothetical protein